MEKSDEERVVQAPTRDSPHLVGSPVYVAKPVTPHPVSTLSTHGNHLTAAVRVEERRVSLLGTQPKMATFTFRRLCAWHAGAGVLP